MIDNQSVQQIELDIDNWDMAPSADSIITPDKPDSKPNIFSKNAPDMTFLDKPDLDDKSKDDDDDSNDKKVLRGTSSQDIKDTLAELDADINNPIDDDLEIDTPSTKGGRPKTEKSGLVEFLRKRIESKEMFAFDDYDETKQDLGDYLNGLSEKDVDDLWQANVENLKQEVAAKTPQEFFQALPEELQYAAKYVMDGGTDLKGMFQALAAVEQVRDLDPTVESDQEFIVKNYLQATNFGTQEEIDEEINTWKELGSLGKKANQFKPKLDMMQEEIVQAQIAEQELRKEQQQAAAQAYTQNVYQALRPAEINGLKLDKKTQAMLYSGLTQAQYPSISGRPTNLLGHLLEKYQYVDPNYPLIAEALWLLSDPESYRKNLQVVGKNQATEQTVRQLKTEQSRKNTYTAQEEEQTRTRKITRPQNIFKR